MQLHIVSDSSSSLRRKAEHMSHLFGPQHSTTGQATSYFLVESAVCEHVDSMYLHR